jgi:hypothetical protein
VEFLHARLRLGLVFHRHRHHPVGGADVEAVFVETADAADLPPVRVVDGLSEGDALAGRLAWLAL